jgi:hypothetical protein
MRLILPLLLLLGATSCVSPSVEKLADEFCKCRNIQEHQSSLQGEQCFKEWDQKYGDLRLSDQEALKFNELISACQGE